MAQARNHGKDRETLDALPLHRVLVSVEEHGCEDDGVIESLNHLVIESLSHWVNDSMTK
jgi:hypothetical protein